MTYAHETNKNLIHHGRTGNVSHQQKPIRNLKIDIGNYAQQAMTCQPQVALISKEQIWVQENDVKYVLLLGLPY